MNRAALQDYYLERSREENFEIDHIRKELSQKGITDEEIGIIVKLVDYDMQRN